MGSAAARPGFTTQDPPPYCCSMIKYAPLVGQAFPYTGAKMQLSRDWYPAPEYPIILEPFAGSACYARMYHWYQILLVDQNPAITRIWKLLQTLDLRANELPDWFDTVPQHLAQDVRDLLGLWASRADRAPRQKMSPWAHLYPDQFWNPKVKRRLIEQAPYLRHWHICAGSYEFLPDIEATWFIDAPYQNKPGLYPYCRLDYEALRTWVLSRRGQIIVCEGQGADWLDFQPLTPGRNKTGQRSGEIGAGEVVWYRQNNRRLH